VDYLLATKIQDCQEGFLSMDLGSYYCSNFFESGCYSESEFDITCDFYSLNLRFSL